MSKNTAGYFYEGPTIHRLFGLSSLALLAATLWMVWQDHDREWKRIQQEARERELVRLRQERDYRQGLSDQAALEKAHSGLEAARRDLEARRGDLEAIESEIQARNTAWFEADQAFRAAKAETDAARYRAEEARHALGDGHASAERARREHEDWLRRLEDLRLRQEEAQAALSDARGRAAALARTRDEADRDVARLTAQTSRIEKRIQAIGHSLANDFFRDQPGVDYMAPILKIRQVAPPDLKDDYHFVRVQKVDRCLTCHVNIDRPGFERERHPFASHPRLDLFLGGRSAHPLDGFGCTVCHGGQGSATDFLHAYHTPSDGKQAEDWEARHGWLAFQEEHAHLWSYPMLPSERVTASCRKCHAGRVALDAADAYNRGKHVFERAGCWGCHKVQGFEPRQDPKPGRAASAADAERLPKVGPDLDDVGCKLDAGFVAKWLADPKGFNPHTRMPSFFGVAPEPAAEDRRREANEIQAITAYLFHASESTRQPPPEPGDPSKGRKAFETLGCLACHTVNGEGAGTRTDMGRRQADFDAFGPDLGRIGSKTGGGWLFAWLKDPRCYFPGGRMPNLRLTDDEAGDIAAYLVTLRDEGFERAAVPDSDPAEMRGLLRDKLRSKETQAVVDYILEGAALPAELAALPEDQRPKPIPPDQVPVELGRHMIRRYGCNGCHVIPGFADDKGIGAELTEIGSKDLGQVDFGFVAAFQEHGRFSENALRTRHAWLEQKVKDPRSFDAGRSKPPLDRLVMPRFGLGDGDARDLATFLLSLNKERVPLHRQERLTEERAAAERARRVIKDSNCEACHVVGAFPRAVEAGRIPQDPTAWLAEHVLVTASGEPGRAPSAQEARERCQREKAGEREALIAPALAFLAQRPALGREALAALQARGISTKGLGKVSDLLAAVERARQQDPFRPAVPFTVRVAGAGEGLPGRWLSDRATETSREESGKFAPPLLGDLGARVHPDWLFRFLLDPAGEYARRGGQPIRPKVPLRMPTFGFTEAQAGDLVRFFASSSGASWPYCTEAPPRLDVETRKGVQFIMAEGWNCRSCHVVDGVVSGPPIGPDLDRLAGRLRRDWLTRYILTPNESQPFVVMPAPFAVRPDGTASPDDAVPGCLGDDPLRQLGAVVEYLLAPPEERGRK